MKHRLHIIAAGLRAMRISPHFVAFCFIRAGWHYSQTQRAPEFITQGGSHALQVSVC